MDFVDYLKIVRAHRWLQQSLIFGQFKAQEPMSEGRIRQWQEAMRETDPHYVPDPFDHELFRLSRPDRTREFIEKHTSRVLM